MSNAIPILKSIETVSCLDNEQVQAKDVMRYGGVSTEKDAPVSEAVNLLVSKKISGLPVTHEGRLVGVLSEKDLLRLLFENEYLPGTVDHYMTPKVVSFDLEDNLHDISHFLVEKHFRRVPITQKGTIAGMITRADLIKYYRQQVQISQPIAGKKRSKDRFDDEIMQYGLITVTPKTPVSEAMDLIVEFKLPGLPVVDTGNALQGVITEKDLLKFICHPTATVKEVGDLMTSDPICFGPKDSVETICACLLSNSFYQVPIVDAGQLKGIISRADILKYRCSFLKR